jgi:hypothetical protein
MKLDEMDIKDLLKEKSELEKLAKEKECPGISKMLREINDVIKTRNNKLENNMDLKNKKIAVLKSNASAAVKLAAVKKLDNCYATKKNDALKAKVVASNASDEVKEAALKRLEQKKNSSTIISHGDHRGISWEVVVNSNMTFTGQAYILYEGKTAQLTTAGCNTASDAETQIKRSIEAYLKKQNPAAH